MFAQELLQRGRDILNRMQPADRRASRCTGFMLRFWHGAGLSVMTSEYSPLTNRKSLEHELERP
jgi:hypothetical protein